MPKYICHGCGTQYADSPVPPAECNICSDDRQHVEWAGQSWTTHDELLAKHDTRIEMDGDLLGISITPTFGIPQRALFVSTDAGNILWDCTSLVTNAVVDELKARGGVDRIIISHPHFYSSMIEWSDALGGVPILLHEADREWVNRTATSLQFWAGDTNQLSPTVCLYRCPGHFPGSTLLHWTGGPGGKRIVLSGDTMHVAGDRRHVSFMYSVPNFIPAHPDHVNETRERLAGIDFDDLYGFTWGLNILGDARAAVDRSFARYFNAIGQRS
jgi:glyoxylase-like metal-dependent hydrolase (beta-lactamase superfamily II)